MQKRAYIQSSHEVDLPCKELWEVISSVQNLEKWHPLINSCTVDGDTRICKTEKGDLIETILVNDSNSKTFKYLIHPQKVYPHEGYIWGTFKVVEGKHASILMWDIEFLETSASLYKEIEESFAVLSKMVKSNLEALELR